MLTRLDLWNFKCFRILKLPLCPLTVLSGANASGKSSVLQALVLLNQTMRDHEWSSRLMLNGDAIRLGTAADVIDQVHGRNELRISLLDGDEGRFEWAFEAEREEMSMAVRRTWGTSTKGDVWDKDDTDPLRYLLPATLSGISLVHRIRGLTYLTAERLGPRDYYAHGDPQITPVVGPRGEYAASILYSRQDSAVLKGLADENPGSLNLLRQVEATMTRLFPGFDLRVEHSPPTNAITLRIRTSRSTAFHRPVHTGFGLTQVFPIVVAAMSSRPESMLLVENPEVHLHPAAQAAMGEFLALASAAGVQVMIETHSDHVLNGIRRAVKRKIVPGEDVALHFFRQPGDAQADAPAQVESPAIDNDGNIDSWPEGFFDQFEKDLKYFIGWK